MTPIEYKTAIKALGNPAPVKGSPQMTRAQALETARKTYAAYISADIEHLFRGAPPPVGADYGYQHGWVTVGDFSFGTDEMVGPNNQPYLD